MPFVVYRHFSQSGELLYVGASVKPFRRLESHNYSSWADKISTVTLEKFATEDEMWAAEIRIIKDEVPTYNRVGNPVHYKRQVELAANITPKNKGGEILKQLLLDENELDIMAIKFKFRCSSDDVMAFVRGDKVPKKRIRTDAWRLSDVRIPEVSWMQPCEPK